MNSVDGTWRARFQPGTRARFLATLILLAVVVIAAVVLVNRHYFFETLAYETGDQAANSLEVLRCKKLEVYLGAYSRWGFHHPGPFLFYWYAAGETLFWQWLHLTRTPINGQVLSVLCLAAGFFAAGVAMAARWVRSPLFVPLAVLFAALHYTAVHLQVCMLDTWPAYASPLPYFCLLLAAASVGAGQGEDLPWLVLAGCVLIHIHVANPLFVLPLFVVAYAGLLAACRTPAPSVPPWRRYPFAHGIAAGLAAVFFLPIAIDLARGGQSNFARIVHHLRTHEGEHHSYLDAAYYLLRFGVYKPSVIGNVKVFDGTTPAEISRFVFSHPEMLLIWAGALLSPLLAVALRFALKPVGALPAAAVPSPERLDRPRWRFLGWLAGCFGLCVLLALFWSHIQDGELLYYNAWYVYSLYGVLTVIAAIAGSDMLERIVRRLRHPAGVARAIGLLCLLGAMAVLISPADPAKNLACLGDSAADRAQARTVFDALAAHPTAPRTKFLVIPNNLALGAAPGVAILLARRGDAFRVLADYAFMFGSRDALPASWLASGRAAPPPMEYWWLIGHPPGAAVSRPLIDDYALAVGRSEIDPAAQPAIVFAGPDRNSDAYSLLGFPLCPPGSLMIWTVGRTARLDFKAHPVPPGSAVELAFDFWPPLIDARNHPSQRLEVSYNGTAVATLTVGATTPPDSLRVRIPGELWNAQPAGILALGFPDAIAPADLTHDPRGDIRLLGFSARKITFRLVDLGSTAARLARPPSGM
jgi:hypothetical protein